jgi:outer membrane protein OmpA-like peptidoglycan-associated protein
MKIMMNKKNTFVKILFIILSSMSFQLVKAQPRLELGGGIEIVRYEKQSWVVPRVLICAPELFMKNKLGIYFGLKFFNSEVLGAPVLNGSSIVDNIGLTYKMTDRWSLYYGRAIFNKQTERPELFPFTGGQDLGASYAFENIPLNLKVGLTLWLGPTFQLTGNIANFSPKDSDKDGVINKKDKCPGTNAKYINNVDEFGCPVDTDKDGVFDLDDKCINEKGLASLDGCPKKVVIEEPIKVVDTVVKVKEPIIETSKYPSESIISIKSVSNYPLNKYELNSEYKDSLKLLVDYLNDNRKVKIRLEGHTDNSGSEEFNKQLSIKRANSVRDYLFSKGVFSIQMEAVGLGETKPKAKGNLPADKTKNRRVEVIFLK